jgi:hypothetical protein
MKLSELLSLLDSKESPYYGRTDDQIIEQCLNTYGVYVDLAGNGFTERPIYQWLCTDTHVGCSAIYWNGEFIAITSQTSRRGATTVEWVSEEVFNRVSAFIKTLVEEEPYKPKCLNLDEEYPTAFKLEVTKQILSDWAFYEGKKYMIEQELTHEEERKDFISNQVWIVTEDGPKQVNINELEFPVLLKEDT